MHRPKSLDPPRRSVPVVRLLLVTDGASRGNPGPAAAAYAIMKPDGSRVAEAGVPIGEATNNEAEYRALLLGLEAAEGAGATELTHVSDSELLVRQLTGVYRVRAGHLRDLYEEAQRLLKRFDRVDHEHASRDDPRIQRVDDLCNEALDRDMARRG